MPTFTTFDFVTASPVILEPGNRQNIRYVRSGAAILDDWRRRHESWRAIDVLGQAILDDAARNGGLARIPESDLAGALLWQCRHLVELSLKTTLTTFQAEWGPLPFKRSTGAGHDLKRLWREIGYYWGRNAARPWMPAEDAELLDVLVNADDIDFLDAAIANFAAMDPDGTIIRYGVSRDGKARPPAYAELDWTFSPANVVATTGRISELLSMRLVQLPRICREGDA